MDSDDTERLAETLRGSISRFVRAVRSDPRTAQDEALDLLDRRGALNVAAMAQARGISHQTMRVVMAKLENAGLVSSVPDDADRRSRLAAITPAGRDVLANARAARTRHIALAINQLPAKDRARVADLVALLDRLANPSG